GRVRQHMSGVREQGERTCNEAADHLSDQHRAGDHEYDDEPFPVLAGGSHLDAISTAHLAHLLSRLSDADLSESEHSIRCSDSDKLAKARHQLVDDLRFAYGNPNPVEPQSGKGLATA